MSTTFANYFTDTIRQMNKEYVDIINPDLDKQHNSIPLIIAQPNIYNKKKDSIFISYKPVGSVGTIGPVSAIGPVNAIGPVGTVGTVETFGIINPINTINSGLVTTGFYKDLNKDKYVQKTFAKYYYYKILDKWFYNELLPLLAFVDIDISSGKPMLIKTLEDFNVEKLSKESKEDIKKKIKYMEEIIITKDMVRHVLKKICNENNINWYDLNKHESKIKKLFYNYLLDKLKKSIN